MDFDTLARLFPDATVMEIASWVERGWVQPEHDGDQLVFQEIDVARVRLIRDLRHELALGEDAVPVVLSLMDQVYELRNQLRTVLHAIENQSTDVRQSLLRALGLERL
ncbi:MAG: chaperone modulator CbpM [Alphaproteobacteria bacterium]|nr:chaperone modulator CbpM [Alphaproteobacteria bacterium]